MSKSFSSSSLLGYCVSAQNLVFVFLGGGRRKFLPEGRKAVGLRAGRKRETRHKQRSRKASHRGSPVRFQKRSTPALPSPHSAAHIRPMAKPPELEESQGPRAPDARQGGARAAGADRARAGEAAQSRHREGNRGRRLADRAEQRGQAGRRANEPLPGEGVKEKSPKTGLQPPADNSWDRREDFSAAHRARKSVASPLPNPPPHRRDDRLDGMRGRETSSCATASPKPRRPNTPATPS